MTFVVDDIEHDNDDSDGDEVHHEMARRLHFGTGPRECSRLLNRLDDFVMFGITHCTNKIIRFTPRSDITTMALTFYWN